MRFALTEDQQLFGAAVQEMLADQCPPERVRHAWQGDSGRDLWRRLAEMGVIGLQASEADGGMGLGALDLHPMLVEAGRVALPDPIIDTAAVAVPLLAAAGHEALGAVVAGDQTVAVAFDGDPLVRIDCDLLLIEGVDAWQLVETSAVDAVAEHSIDGARRLATLASQPTGGDTVSGDPAMARQRAVVAQGSFLIGLARHLLDETVAYVQVREQFGKPVGSQQAIKHKLSDVRLAVDYAGPMVARAAHSIDAGAADAAIHASMAKATAADAAKLAVRHALQCHGAIAYTVEYDLHMWMKRVWAVAAQWGTADRHRDVVRAHLGL